MRFNWNPDWGSLLPSGSGVANVLRGIDPDDSDGFGQLGNWISPKSDVGSGLGALVAQISDRSYDKVEENRLHQHNNAAPTMPKSNGPMSLLEMFMRGGQGATSAGSNPYQYAIKEMRRQMGQAQLQTQQNIADIGSWFGQAEQIAQHGANSVRKGNKKANRDANRFNHDLMAGIADPNVAHSVGAAGASGAKYTRRSGRDAGQYAQFLVGDLGRQEAYQKLVQQRLGAQQQVDMRSQLAGLKAQKAQYRIENGGGDERLGRLLQIIGMLPEEMRVPLLTGQAAPGEASQFGTDERGDMAGVLSELIGDTKDVQFGGEGNRLQDILPRLRTGLRGAGYDLGQPDVRQSYLDWLYANFLGRYNSQNQGGQTDYTLGQGGIIPL